MSAAIKLTCGLFTIVDAEDYEWLNQWKWYALAARDGYYYATRKIRRLDGKQSGIYMHREIAGTKPGQHTDHRNHNTLDNRRANLRSCSRAENGRNRRLGIRSSTGFKGVCFVRNRGRYRASIKYNGRTKYLGYFDTREEARAAHDQAATETVRRVCSH